MKRNGDHFGSVSFQGRFGDHFRVGDHFGGCTGRPILLITSMITDRIGLYSVLLPLLIIIIIIIIIITIIIMRHL